MADSATPAQIAATLARVYLFQGFDEASLARLAHAATLTRHPEGEVVAREGDAGDALFVVRSGSVRVSKAGDGGTPEQVVLLAPGQHVGEISFLDGAPRSASVVAAEPCELIRLGHAAVAGLLHAQPRLAASFYRALATALGSRLRATTDDVAFLKHLARELRKASPPA